MASYPPGKRLPPAPSNPVLLAAQTQWLFTDEELAHAPSQLDGMKMEQETIQRSKGVTFITQVGIMLKLPQPTLATAAVYFHRFFMRYSMVDKPDRPGMHPYPIAATSLFLATKVEENVRRMKEIVVACCRVAQKQPNLVVDEQSKDFWRWRDTILHNEDVLLEALCFDLQLEQPYRVLYDYLCFFGVNDNKELRNSSWAFLNDSMFTALCLQFSARIIAAAALYAAARHSDIGFEDDQHGRSWWEQLDIDLTQVRRACTRMAELYESNAAHKHSPYYPTTTLLWDEGTEKTRIPRSGTNLDASDTASRKRSREPEDHQASQNTVSLKPDEASQDGRHSPKRPRVGSDAENSRSAAGSFASTSTLPHGGDGAPPPLPSATSPPPPSSSSHDRNGHHTHRYQHPLPPTPRTAFPPRRTSETKSVDPIQQRIDEIVQQSTPSPTQTKHKRIPDRGSHYRDQDDDEPSRNRKSSHSSSTARNDQPPPRDRDRDHDRDRESERDRERVQPPPPPPPEPAPDDEERGGSEEGEL